MPLMTTKPMFDLAYDGGFAIGAFNVNNMEITQGIIEACAAEKRLHPEPFTGDPADLQGGPQVCQHALSQAYHRRRG